MTLVLAADFELVREVLDARDEEVEDGFERGRLGAREGPSCCFVGTVVHLVSPMEVSSVWLSGNR